MAGLFATVALSPLADAALLAHYDFSDGNLLDDESGNGYTLTQPFNTGTGITLNGDGFSAHFDGGTDDNNNTDDNYLTTSSAFNAAAGTAYTVSMWFKTTVTAPGENYSIFGTSSSGGSTDWQMHAGGGPWHRQCRDLCR